MITELSTPIKEEEEGCNLKIGGKAEVTRNKLTCCIETSPYDRGECLYTN